MKYVLFPLILCVAACGGSGTTPLVEDEPDQQDPQDPQEQAEDTGSPAAPGLQVENPLNFAAGESFNTFAFDTYNAAPDATQSALVSTQIGGFARYSGDILARLGADSEFLSGNMRLNVGFQAGTVSGTVTGMQFAGDDSAGRSTIPDLDKLSIAPVSLNGNNLTATVAGTFDEGGFFGFAAPVDQHTVDATMDITFVDTNPGDGQTEMVGTIHGTITSTNDGERTLVGIAAADSGF